MKQFRTIFLAYLLLTFAAYTPAQHERGMTTISGNVSSAVQVSVPRGWGATGDGAGGLHVAAVSAGVSTVQVAVSSNGLSSASQFAVPLEIRTNTAYELTLTLTSSEGPVPTILASIGALRAGGALVSPRALEVTNANSPVDLSRSVAPTAVLNGRRISIGGNFATPTNALVADLNITVPQDGPAQSFWRAQFQVSIHPAQ